ncbi:P-loop containing nucleoside triphosphate hydrolase protein [Massariosphaeria phaeospora]|uniref:P-loop containing nucleoside triphosphate hydrolase protein n=1 Tax=Massariosphaeria phaeospora TaxID=100035 RepID=A0A7C8MAL4_9PLEO|nr:P-loop containing nucleoside triphosphate hydrolase protein [Massariosphaeria phaeospora]
MRANSTQKTYDEAFLACSTAVYFESQVSLTWTRPPAAGEARTQTDTVQHNESEALRSWRSALDQIYYHNAHRLPSNSRPVSETDKALLESLRQLELQCKERVDLLEALKQSREDAKEPVKPSPPGVDADVPPPPPPRPPPHGTPLSSPNANGPSSWLGGGTIPPIGYPDLSRPPLPYRPSLQSRKSSGAESSRVNSLTAMASGLSLSSGPAGRKEARTPSPEKKGRMLRTLRPGGRDGSRPSSSSKLPASMRSRPPEASKAATQAWGSKAASSDVARRLATGPQYPSTRSSFERSRSGLESEHLKEQVSSQEPYQPRPAFYLRTGGTSSSASIAVSAPDNEANRDAKPPIPPKASTPPPAIHSLDLGRFKSDQGYGAVAIPYRNEYPMVTPDARQLAASAAARSRTDLDPEKFPTPREPAQITQTTLPRQRLSSQNTLPKRETVKKELHRPIALEATETRRKQPKAKAAEDTVRADLPSTSSSEEECSEFSGAESDEWTERVRSILKNLPRGVDPSAAQQILNEIVIKGDEVHWEDVAGLDIAKSALKENVVYPFLRPDLFMGLREPARGMLLFGPPGTGKTMLARAVATESKSTFFAISASSLTSKFLGESEKLVRALFALAKMLAPSIIFVDEIDSLLSSRSGSGEHEATRRIKTEFLIQWSDLAKAAAGREQSEKEKEKGDASRVLVLAATNLPWAIDEAARRRFVRRQYIPLPEDHVRKTQVQTLLSHQKHELSEGDMDRLVLLTDGFSGSDITALAKDAAMGPLRSLGEKLLHMTMDEIRPIQVVDFEASLKTIRPSVSKKGLQEFEDWAREFGERGG